jgi:hypothetical protein
VFGLDVEHPQENGDGAVEQAVQDFGKPELFGHVSF